MQKFDIFFYKYINFLGGFWFRIICNIRASGDEAGRYRDSEQVIKVDKKGRREIIHSELAYILNIATYFVFMKYIRI